MGGMERGCARCSFIAPTSDRLDLTGKQAVVGTVAIHVAADGLQPQRVTLPRFEGSQNRTEIIAFLKLRLATILSIYN